MSKISKLKIRSKRPFKQYFCGPMRKIGQKVEEKKFTAITWNANNMGKIKKKMEWSRKLPRLFARILIAECGQILRNFAHVFVFKNISPFAF